MLRAFPSPDFSRFSAPLARTLLLLVIFLFPATLLRLALYAKYYADFQALSAGQVLEALLVGLRFDLSMAMLLIGLPLLLLLLPFRWSQHIRWQRAWAWFIYLALLLFVLMTAIDAVYFGYVHRHVGAEIKTIAADWDSMLILALRQHGGLIALFCGAALGGALMWARLLRVFRPEPPASPVRRLLMFPPLVLLVLIAGRGGVTGKPLSVGEAFFSNLPAQGYLALNGAFALSRALIDSTPPLKSFMPQAQAVEIVQRQLAGDKHSFLHPDFPLYRQMTISPLSHKPNIVVMVLESWGALHVDASRRAMGKPPLGATPNFDALAKQGRLYTRFYANGQRSIQGIEAVLAGQPTFPDMPFLGEGIEQNRQSFMGELARANGYQTYFLQSSDRSSLRFDVVSSRAGFTEYRGAEDMPNLHPQPKPPHTWGTWDHNTLQSAHRLFSEARQPFLGFIFTSTTHTPWIVPDARWQNYRGGDLEKFLNSLNYADWALGEFIAAAKQAGYFDNTIFVLTADHANEFVEQPEVTPNLYHIPLLLVGPGVPPGLDERVGSQFDIVPTLMDLAGWQAAYAGLGRSLLDEQRLQDRASLSIRGNILDWIEPSGWASHDLNQALGGAPQLSPAQQTALRQRLLATYQVTSRLQSNNHIAPP